ncbi:MAG: hypothetical protein ABL956_08535 [Hyphomonadaceae bacterium]
MVDDSFSAHNQLAPAPMLAPVIPSFMVWVSVYAAVFCVCSGMITYLYRRV